MPGIIDTKEKIEKEYKEVSKVAKDKFKRLADELKRNGFISDYQLHAGDKDSNLSLTLHRSPDKKTIVLRIYPKGEIYSVAYDHDFMNVQYAYDMPDKLVALD